MPSPRTPKLRLPSRATQICRFTGQPWVWDPASTPLVPYVLQPPGRSPRGSRFSKHPRRALLPHQVGKRGQNDQSGKARRQAHGPTIRVIDASGMPAAVTSWRRARPRSLLPVVAVWRAQRSARPTVRVLRYHRWYPPSAVPPRTGRWLRRKRGAR